MHEQQQCQQPLTVAHDEPVQISPLHPWQPPRLERLHVSLDTAQNGGDLNDLNVTGAGSS